MFRVGALARCHCGVPFGCGAVVAARTLRARMCAQRTVGSSKCVARTTGFGARMHDGGDVLQPGIPSCMRGFCDGIKYRTYRIGHNKLFLVFCIE